MGTFRPLPVRRAHEDFAVTVALLTMKFVDWHGRSITGMAENSRRELFAVRLVVTVPAAQCLVAGVFKQKFQRWRFDVPVAKGHVRLVLMPVARTRGAFSQIIPDTARIDNGCP